MEIHYEKQNWETSVPKTASERPQYPILLEFTELQCCDHRLLSYLSSMRFLLKGALYLGQMDRHVLRNNEKLPHTTVQVLKREEFPSPRLKVPG